MRSGPCGMNLHRRLKHEKGGAAETESWPRATCTHHFHPDVSKANDCNTISDILFQVWPVWLLSDFFWTTDRGREQYKKNTASGIRSADCHILSKADFQNSQSKKTLHTFFVMLCSSNYKWLYNKWNDGVQNVRHQRKPLPFCHSNKSSTNINLNLHASLSPLTYFQEYNKNFILWFRKLWFPANRYEEVVTILDTQANRGSPDHSCWFCLQDGCLQGTPACRTCNDPSNGLLWPNLAGARMRQILKMYRIRIVARMGAVVAFLLLAH